MPWDLHVAQPAERELDRVPAKDRVRIVAALQAMQESPFAGDIARLNGQSATWRRRVGDWRIFFDVNPDKLSIVVLAIRRRTSSTY
jgi:mRNA-degrading endonuclease RelE of RelBE toxin-antitoxin system